MYVSKKDIEKIYEDILSINNFVIYVEISGLIVGLEQFYDKLMCHSKKIIKSKKRFELDTLAFVSDLCEDVNLFFQYIGYFNEGNMRMSVYSKEKRVMIIENIDGDELMLLKV